MDIDSPHAQQLGLVLAGKASMKEGHFGQQAIVRAAWNRLLIQIHKWLKGVSFSIRDLGRFQVLARQTTIICS